MEGRKNEDKPQMIYYGHRSVAPVAAYPLIHSSLCTVFTLQYTSLTNLVSSWILQKLLAQKLRAPFCIKYNL